MFFRIDPSDDLAIYDQVVRQVKFAVAGEVVRVGELVPSVRELARELTINPNTVARAYRQLQADGVLEPIRGTGLAVAAGAHEQCRTERVTLIRARLRQVLFEARQSRLDSGQLRSLIESELAHVEREEV
ncbi:MAG TPA: GntR family transcriptional regulator [Thermoguttaceae bacterium]|nr:GntR family transcriptional regulator [Thermoguttaceae bacterium]